MKHRGLKFLSLLLSLALLVGLLSGMSAYADSIYETYKTNGTLVKIEGVSNVDWYIIDYSDTTVTLFTKECIGGSKFDENGSSNTYENSTVYNYLAAQLEEGGKFASISSAVSEISLLTQDQASRLSNNQKKCTSVTYQGFWWLCSQGYTDKHAYFVGCRTGSVQNGQSLDYINVGTELGVRPALKLDLSKVTFDSTSNTFTLKPAGFTVTYVHGEGTGEDQTFNAIDNGQGGYKHDIEKCEDNFTAPEGKHFDHWDDGKGRTYKYGDTINPVTEDITLTAQWKKSGSDGGDRRDGGSGGGFDLVFNIPGEDNSWEYVGGYAPQQAYRVSLAPMQGGSAALGLTTGDSGTQMNVYPSTTVYVFPNAEQGYTLDKIVWSLIDGSASYDITEAKNFVMPAMDVVVYVTFKPVG